jgi:peptidase A4-like protein
MTTRNRDRRSRRSRRAAALLATAVVTLPAIATSPTAAAAASLRHAAVTSNWAGYAITGRSGVRFRRVSSVWTQPKSSCASGQQGFAAFWIGLGGYRQSSQALEQIGTEADCTASGRSSYYAWYELVPDGPVGVRMSIHPGDRIASSVSVAGRRVSFSMRDLTTGAAFSRSVTASGVDLSSAEWIAEAPSVCDNSGSCQILPLSDFGGISFSHAYATSTRGHSGAIGDSAWSAAALELQDVGGTGPGRFAASATAADAVPASLSTGGSAFSVLWRQLQVTQQPPAMGPFSA